MSTTLQLSTKPSDDRNEPAILVVKVEAPDNISPDAVWGVFVQTVAEAGLQSELDRFDPINRATAVAQAGLGATPVEAAVPAPAASGGWGQPPVAPYQPTPQLPAAAQSAPVGTAPVCHHGTKEYISGISKSGKNAGKKWQAWACPADRDDPGKCDKEWIRD